MKLFSSSLDASDEAGSRALEQRVAQTRERAAHEMLPNSMAVGLIAALGIIFTLQSKVPHHLLATWFAARCLISAVRFGHAMLYLRWRRLSTRHPMRAYRVLAALDGLIWGALGWAITPFNQLDVAIVAVGVLIGVAALGAFILHVDMPSAALFIVPILVPNGFYALGRSDLLGWFCNISLLGLTALFLQEARRSNRRIVELLRLRFQSERVALAQEEALKQARMLSETKSRFVATMSHEMRTPLHGILGLVRLLRQREVDPLASRQLDLIRSSGDHLVNVINDVLDFARLEADGLPVHKQRFNLHVLLSEMAETANVTACEKGLELALSLELGRDTERVGDPVRIRQILHNLLGNAIKFTQHGFVRLTVSGEPDGSMVCFQVRDTGVGIPADELGKVFDAFHQAEGTYQRRFGGTGLGLTISRELARAMGGDIRCESVMGMGSIFTLTLPLPVASRDEPPVFAPMSAPLSASAASAPQAPVSEGLAGRGRDKAGAFGEAHVLLVEDNPVNTLVAEAELRRLGTRVTVLENGRLAVDWLEQHRPDLVLMDCEMPEMDGLQATRIIRERERSTGRAPVTIVALTANGLESHIGHCVEVGMNDHLAKPFHMAELARMLARHLKHCTVQG